MFKYTEAEIKNILKQATVVIDTREQKCSHITEYLDKYKINYCYEKLEFGDYTMKVFLPHANRDFYLGSRCSIERKANLNELSGNFTQSRDRIEKEFLRGKGALHLLIENANYEDIELYNYDTGYNPKAFMATLKAFESRYNLHIHYQKNIKFSGDYIYKTLIYNLRELLVKGEI